MKTKEEKKILRREQRKKHYLLNKLKFKIYYEDNKEKIKNYYLNNQEELKNISRLYYQKNKKLKKIYYKIYKLNHRKQINEQIKNRRNTDPLFNLKISVHNLIGGAFKNKGVKKINKAVEILGCPFNEFKDYLESKFEPWMTWENKGLYNGTFNYGWDIDHIIGLKNAKTEKDIIQLNHYTNLQPLCSHINRDIKK